MSAIKRIMLPVVVLSVTLCLAAGSPVFAHAIGADKSSESQHNSSNVTINENASGTGRTKTVVVDRHDTTQTVTTAEDTNPEPGDDNGMHIELHRQGDAMVTELRQQRGDKTKTAEQRQKVCEAHKSGLTNKFKRTVTNSQRIQTRIDEVFNKAQTYQQTKNITVANWDSLVASAQTAKAASAASITALQGVTPTIDCNSTSVASDVATFKTAAGQTRDNLKAYRTAVKALLKALITAKSTSEGRTN